MEELKKQTSLEASSHQKLSNRLMSEIETQATTFCETDPHWQKFKQVKEEAEKVVKKYTIKMGKSQLVSFIFI